jgi:hypothetical protein
MIHLNDRVEGGDPASKSGQSPDNELKCRTYYRRQNESF